MSGHVCNQAQVRVIIFDPKDIDLTQRKATKKDASVSPRLAAEINEGQICCSVRLAVRICRRDFRCAPAQSHSVSSLQCNSRPPMFLAGHLRRIFLAVLHGMSIAPSREEQNESGHIFVGNGDVPWHDTGCATVVRRQASPALTKNRTWTFPEQHAAPLPEMNPDDLIMVFGIFMHPIENVRILRLRYVLRAGRNLGGKTIQTDPDDLRQA